MSVRSSTGIAWLAAWSRLRLTAPTAPPSPHWTAPMVAADETLPVLIEHVRHRFPATRLRAIKALGKLGPDAATALPALTVVLDDADSKVREAAAAAIGQLGLASLPTLG